MLLAFLIRNSKRSRKLIFIAIITLYLFSNPFIVDEVIRMWECHVVPDKNLTDQFDVGIVLGGGMITFDKENNRLSFRDNVDRIMQAVRLYKSGKIQKILISGGSGSLLYRDMKESELLKDYFVEIGIPSYDMIIETTSDNTYENAKYTSEILLNEYPESSYLLITSAIHMRRAKACFNKFDIELSTYPTNKLVGKRRYQFSYMFVPDVNSLGRWNIFLHEFFGYLVYKVMGYA